jgi:2-iminobutanoate/2-iminopropanoate deaminase
VLRLPNEHSVHYLIALLFSGSFERAGGKARHSTKEFATGPGASGLPYSPGILIDGTLYIAGQVGRDLKTGQIPTDFESEVRNALDNAGLVLKAVGLGFEDAVAVQVYLTDMDLFPRMNRVYATYFKDPRPARTTVGVAKLVGTARIEITITARK